MTDLSSKPRGRWLTAILVGGLIAGLFDIIFAVVVSAMHGRPWMATLQSVAAGLLGQASYEGGMQTAALGLGLHFAMMLLIAAIYVTVVRNVPWLARQTPWLTGPMYGVAVYFVMNRVVIPFSAFPMKTPVVPINFLNLAGHMFLIGLVIALAQSRLDGPRRR